MPKGLQPKGIIRREKILHAAIRLFLRNGYEKTTTAAIAAEAGISPSSFFAAFENKEALLLALVTIMFDKQFESAGRFSDKSTDPLLLYAAETAIQIYVTDMSEALRETYVMAYSLPSTSEYIYQSTSERLPVIFSAYMPQAKLKDFYEMDIASSGMMRAFMAKPCDMYFTVEKKIMRFLQCSLTLYHVPEEKQNTVIGSVLQMDLKTTAENLIGEMARMAETDLYLEKESGMKEPEIMFGRQP